MRASFMDGEINKSINQSITIL